MNKKLLALTLAVFVACGVAGCGGGDKKPAKPADPPKQAENVKKDDKQATNAAKDDEAKKAEQAKLHAQQVMKLPEVAKYDKISKDAYPNLKWGSTGYTYKGPKNALLDYGEVLAGFHRTLDSDSRPKFKLDDGREVKGDEYYDINVLVGGCKGNCVIEVVSTHTKKLDPASYKKPIEEKKVLVPFDKTYVRHDENGKKWVTHEKCGTK